MNNCFFTFTFFFIILIIFLIVDPTGNVAEGIISFKIRIHYYYYYKIIIIIIIFNKKGEKIRNIPSNTP